MTLSAPSLAQPTATTAEDQFLASINLDAAWPTLERFAHLTRSSGSAEEREAVNLLTQQLGAWGVPYTLHEPVCFISIPGKATLRDITNGVDHRAKTSAMSKSTDGRPLTAEIVYLPAAPGADLDDIITDVVTLEDLDVTGKIVVTEGMPFPGIVTAVANAGALAGIFVAPGVDIHETICTTIWGTPDLDNVGNIPTLPVVAVNNPSGLALIELAQSGGEVTLATEVDTGWRPIPILVAEIAGSVAPNEFVLLHGHIDSWHVGIGDNATGNVTKLELARALWANRNQLARSVRVAWWSGHSHGRYAGSTWYADSFGVDLALNCVAQINCDSPGCRWADTFNELTCMAEAEPLVHATIEGLTGVTPVTERPVRAGDYSFNQIGISSYMMLSSTMSSAKKAEVGYYEVGGCGGNIAWHTENDTLEIADKDNTLRDMRVYGALVWRTANAPLHPFDWTRATTDFAATLNRYQAAAGDVFDFGPSQAAVAGLSEVLNVFYAKAPTSTDLNDPAVHRFNKIQRRLARILVPVNFSRQAPFWHDPALSVFPLPDLEPALRTETTAADVHGRGVLTTHLTRGQNRLVWALLNAGETASGALV